VARLGGSIMTPMRLLTLTDLFIALGLFAIASAAPVSHDSFAILAIPICVCGAVGSICGRMSVCLAAGMMIDAKLFVVALCAGV
jgi:hypothetical protein